MKIYTKTGDDGTTGLLGGGRVSKFDMRIESLGSLDELNATIGLTLAYDTMELERMLNQIQALLFEVGSELAVEKGYAGSPASLADYDILDLERDMDRMTDAMPPLTAFVLPGGTEVSARLHLARAICRRCERAIWELHQAKPVRPIITTYLNRLSDWLFVAARWANHVSGVADTIWHPRNEP
ncbi:MAG: Cob(I)yrinic acid a,c-diamide adenosyltransferase [Fimbriimonadaceae bacterium]|nr:Cob(I)yrinic acid a,c-diamide adenosyltransferase [Fimbriimonadaceae bacterium]